MVSHLGTNMATVTQQTVEKITASQLGTLMKTCIDAIHTHGTKEIISKERKSWAICQNNHTKVRMRNDD